MALRILIFSIAIGADYSFYVTSIATYAPTFLGYNNSVLAIVQDQNKNKGVKFVNSLLLIGITKVTKDMVFSLVQELELPLFESGIEVIQNHKWIMVKAALYQKQTVKTKNTAD